MAASITGNTSFISENPGAFFAPALFVGNSLETFGNQYGGVTDKTQITKVNATSIFGAPACNFTTIGTMSITQRDIEVEKVGIRQEMCIETVAKMHESALMKSPNDVPAELSNFFVGYIAKEMGKGIDALAWTGDTGSGSVINGLFTLAKADSAVISLTGSTVTSATVIAALDTFYASVSDNLSAQTDLKLYMPLGDIIKYMTALKATNQFNGAADATFKYALHHINSDIQLVPVNGLASGEWFLTPASNLALAYDFNAQGQKGEIKVLVLSEVTGDDVIRMKGDWRFGVNYGQSVDVVIRKRP
jgi:hypothetical protein